MRTTLNVNEQLLDEAQRLTGESNKGRVVDRALEELIRRKKVEQLIALAGTIDIRDNWEEWEDEEIEAMKHGHR